MRLAVAEVAEERVLVAAEINGQTTKNFAVFMQGLTQKTDVPLEIQAHEHHFEKGQWVITADFAHTDGNRGPVSHVMSAFSSQFL